MKSSQPESRDKIKDSEPKQMPVGKPAWKKVGFKPPVPLMFDTYSDAAETFRRFAETDFTAISTAEIAKAHSFWFAPKDTTATTETKGIDGLLANAATTSTHLLAA